MTFSGLATLKLVNTNSPRRLVPANSHKQLSQTGQQCQRPGTRDGFAGKDQTTRLGLVIDPNVSNPRRVGNPEAAASPCHFEPFQACVIVG
jgi:hypothetical protein